MKNEKVRNLLPIEIIRKSVPTWLLLVIRGIASYNLPLFGLPFNSWHILCDLVYVNRQSKQKYETVGIYNIKSSQCKWKLHTSQLKVLSRSRSLYENVKFCIQKHRFKNNFLLFFHRLFSNNHRHEKSLPTPRERFYFPHTLCVQHQNKASKWRNRQIPIFIFFPFLFNPVIGNLFSHFSLFCPWWKFAVTCYWFSFSNINWAPTR